MNVAIRNVMHGGEDAFRPAVFNQIGPGTYTVCVVVGPPLSAEKAAYIARATEVYKAEFGEEYDGNKFREVAEQVQAETGYEPKMIEWDAFPLRCQQAEVTAAAESRVVVVEQP